MAIVNIACPACAQIFRGSDDVQGTRIRCPLCGHSFVVTEFAPDEPAMATAAKAPRKAARDDDDEDDDPNPYGVRTLDLRPRCPNCANEMESEDAIVCLYCGYNTQTRTAAQTKRVVHQSGVDKTKWILPGVLTLCGMFLLVLLQLLYVLGLGGMTRGVDWWLWNLLCS